MKAPAVAILMMAMSFTSTAAIAASLDELPAITLAMEQEQQTIDLAAAIIRSQGDLQRYLQTTPDSSLHRLPASARQMFIDSLVFTPRGLGSYSYLPLQTLSVTEIHQILSLFGVQTSLEAIPGLRARTAAEHLMLRPMSRPGRPNSQCYMGDKGTYCRVTQGSVCPTSCEPFAIAGE